MIRRFWSAILVLCFVVVGLVATAPPTSAAPATTWPIHYPGEAITAVTAHPGGDMSVLSCGGNVNKPNGYYYDNGELRSQHPSFTASQLFCSTTSGAGETSKDGTFYTTHFTTSGSVETSSLVAYKNDRQLWSVDTATTTNCISWSGGAGSKRQTLDSMSIGADGKLYGLLKAIYPSTQCPDVLVSVVPSTGVITEIASFASTYTTGVNAESKAWTYADVIVVASRAGTVYEYSYAGVENTAARTTFGLSSGETLYSFIANETGTVFAGITAYPSTGRLAYRTSTGATGSIPSSSADQPRLTLGADDSVNAFYGNFTFDTFTVSGDTLATTTLTNPHASTHPNGRIDGLVEDTDGNLLVFRTFFSSNWANRLVAVDLLEDGTGTPVLQFQMVKDTGTPGSPNPLMQGAAFDQAIADSTLYLSLCQLDDFGACVSGGANSDSWLHKVELDGFGDSVRAVFGYNDYESDKLEYVAMGDSFSSGEGVEPFLTGTDRADDTGTASVNEENRCHRSEDAYPMLLEEDASLNLDLTAFVACSGATTNTVLNGGSGGGAWGEAPQVNALSESTDIVTITIGGNDVGFADALKKCIYTNELAGTWTGTQEEYDRYMCAQEVEKSQSIINGYTLLNGETFKTKFKSMLATILNRVSTETQVYILGYPNLFPEYESIPAPGLCTWGFHPIYGTVVGTSNRLVGEEEIGLLRMTAGELDTTLSTGIDEVDDARLHFLDVRTTFADHEVCSYDPYIFQINVPVTSGSYHPNESGQVIYSETASEELD